MRINDKLNSVIKFISGGVAYSLVDKVINYNSVKAENAAQAIRDQKLDNIQSDVNLLGNFVKENLKVIKECREAYGISLMLFGYFYSLQFITGVVTNQIHFINSYFFLLPSIKLNSAQSLSYKIIKYINAY